MKSITDINREIEEIHILQKRALEYDISIHSEQSTMLKAREAALKWVLEDDQNVQEESPINMVEGKKLPLASVLSVL